jgi:hypothetical protein
LEGEEERIWLSPPRRWWESSILGSGKTTEEVLEAVNV